MSRAARCAIAAAVIGLLAVAGPVAAGNPSGTGQPNADCEESTTAPPGFGSGGFSVAEQHYAGSGAPSSNANSDNAVSQYDVACYQVSLHR